MALRVSCPNGHQLNLNDELAGKKVKCPRCQEMFVVPGGAKDASFTAKPARAAAAPPGRKRVEDDDDEDQPRRKKPAPRDEDDDDDDGPRRKKAAVRDEDEDDDDDDGESKLSPEERRKERMRDRRRRLALVNTGLLMHLIKLWIYAVLTLAVVLNVLFLIIISVLATVAAADRDISPEAIVLFAFLQFIFFCAVATGVIVAPIVGVVGSGFCLMVPKKSEARGTIITSFVFDIIPMVATGILGLAFLDVFGMEIDTLEGAQKLERLDFLIRLGSGFFTLAAWFLFMVYVRQLGQYVGQPGLGNEALNLIAYLIVQIISLPITMILTLYLFRWIIALLGSFVGIIIMFIVMICWFAQFYYLFFVGMIRLLNAMRAAIKEEI